MKIGSVDLRQDVLVIAEIGNNHEGSFTLAEEMVGRAAETGAQAVKFQTLIPELFISPQDQARLERLRKFALSFEQFASLAKLAESLGLIFLSTPLDLESARFVAGICPAIKISSGDNTFLSLLRAVAATGKPLLLSTGLADLEVVRRAKLAVEEVWQATGTAGELALLHCVSSYPTKEEEANLGAIRTLEREFGTVVGYSDHTLGIEAAVLSVALGARIVEKHFTLDKNYSDFRDHQLSADPAEMTELVRRVRQATILIGDGAKSPRPSEIGADQAIRRSAAAASDLPAGTVLGIEHLIWVRPGTGIPDGGEGVLLGRRLARPVGRGELILAADVQ